MRAELRPGDSLDDRYDIHEEIGRGGFGIVYRATQRLIRRQVAVKLLAPPSEDERGPWVETFRHEAQHTSRLSHPNIITLFDFGETAEGAAYLVTELLEGQTLADRLDQSEAREQAWAMSVGLQIAKALAEAHAAGIVHGDLKPENIFLIPMPGEGELVKVLDFGIARLVGDLEPSRRGTLRYMAPEQFEGLPGQVTSDVYAAGLLLRECVVGPQTLQQATLRLSGLSSAEVALPLPASLGTSGLGGVIRRATEYAPEHRFKDGSALLRALTALKDGALQRSNDSALDGVVIGSSPPMAAPRQTRPSRFGAYAHRQRTNPRVAAPEPAPAAPASRPGALTGRVPEQVRLLELLDEALGAQKGGVIFLKGAYGIGKGRASRWLCQEAGVRYGASVGSGHASAGTLKALAAALSAALGAGGVGEEPSKMLAALERRMGRAMVEAERRGALALYGWLGAAQGRALKDAARLLIALTEAGPLLLHLDSVEAATAPIDGLIEAVVEALGAQPAPLVLLCTMASDEPAREPGLLRVLHATEAVAVVSLSPLDPAASATCAADALAEVLGEGGQEIDGALIELMVSRSGGNPLYIKRLASLLDNASMLSSEGGRVKLTEGVEPDHLIPPIFSEMMTRRLTRLFDAHPSPRHARLLLLRAAQLGERFDEALLVQYLEREARDGHACARQALDRYENLIGALEQQQALEIVVAPGRDGDPFRRVAFRQPLMRQVLLKRDDFMPTSPRTHRLAAEVKRLYHGASGQLAGRWMEIERHETRSALQALQHAPEGWEAHLDCWPQD